MTPTGLMAAFRRFWHFFFNSGPDKIPEQRVGIHGPGFEFRMKLAAEKPGMIFDFNNLHQILFWREPGKTKAFLFQRFQIRIVEFIPVPVPFGNLSRLVGLVCQRILFHQLARIRTQAHGAAFFRIHIPFLNGLAFFVKPFPHQINHRGCCFFVKFRTVGI